MLYNRLPTSYITTMSESRKPKLGLKLNVAPVASTSQSSLNNEKVSKESRLKLKPEDLVFISELGAGSGGTVAKVQYKKDNTIMARKAISPFYRKTLTG